MDQAAAERKLQEAVGFTYYPVGSNENWRDAAVSRLWNHAVSLQSQLDEMRKLVIAAEKERLKALGCDHPHERMAKLNARRSLGR